MVNKIIGNVTSNGKSLSLFCDCMSQGPLILHSIWNIFWAISRKKYNTSEALLLKFARFIERGLVHCFFFGTGRYSSNKKNLWCPRSTWLVKLIPFIFVVELGWFFLRPSYTSYYRYRAFSFDNEARDILFHRMARLINVTKIQ